MTVFAPVVGIGENLSATPLRLESEASCGRVHARNLRRQKGWTMHFAYQGFTQEGDRRCFAFRGIGELSPPAVFSIEVDLPLLFRNRVPMQEGPAFCLQMLMTASLAGPTFLERFRHYRVLESDFHSLLIERARRDAENTLRKLPRRRPGKPSSNVHLGTSFREH